VSPSSSAVARAGEAAGDPSGSPATWAERAADRAPLVRRSRDRGVQQARSIVEAAQRLIATNKTGFTIQQLLKEAGIALQTFYRYFEGKDQLLLAVIENMVEESCHEFRERAQDLSDPVSRLRSYVTSVVTSLDTRGDNTSGPRFITTEHWRLFPLYPDEVTRATQPFSDLLLEEIKAATASGQLNARDADNDAWLINQLVMAVYHHYAFAVTDESTLIIADRLWTFLLAGLGAADQTGAGTPSSHGESD
jgi:AcrR family transcriptional regulator